MIKIDGVLRPDEPMAGHTSFALGGPADLYAAARTPEDAAQVLGLCLREGVPCFILGGGTNILVADRGIRGVVLDVSRLDGVRTDGTTVTAMSGALISGVAEEALAHGLTGMEFAYALPGSVGGAVWMNARCYEREISDIVVNVDYIDDGLQRHQLGMTGAEWAYKKSPFQEMRCLILEASFRLSPGDPDTIRPLMQEHKQDRERKGHFLFPCAGSVFKNNRAFGAPTGKLVDSLGLKGRRIGGAQVAPFHGNIIVNTGGASARDVLSLIELLEDEVRQRLGFTLEREVILAGEWGEQS
jgi:UDP-N-acetylmuramate dehydrogenase